MGEIFYVVVVPFDDNAAFLYGEVLANCWIAGRELGLGLSINHKGWYKITLIAIEFKIMKVTVYQVALNQPDLDLGTLSMRLSDQERVRMARFLREEDARAFAVSHVAMRQCLADILSVDEGLLQLSQDQHSKPYLKGYQDRLHFNLSHSKDYALIAVSEQGAVGVDIEYHRERIDCLALSERFFAKAEHAFLLSVSESDRLSAFYDIWTAKEAYVKAIGQGLSYGLDRFSVVSSEIGLSDGYDLKDEGKKTQDSWVISALNVPNWYSAALSTRSKAFISLLPASIH